MHETLPRFLTMVLIVGLAGCAGDNPIETTTNPHVDNAGVDRTISVGETAILDGSASTDPAGGPFTFSWSFTTRPAGSAATLTDANASTASFAPDIAGVYEIELAVSNGMASDTDVVTAAEGFPLSCAGIDRSMDGESLRSNTVIAADTTMTGTYRVPAGSRTRLRGAVTIEAGTIFILESDASIWFESESEGAGLFANGDPDRPVLFCGASAGAGFWNEIQLRFDGPTPSRLSHVRIEDGGGQQSPMITSLRNAVVLESVELHNSGDIGLRAASIAAGSSDLTITGSARHPLQLEGWSVITNLPAGSYTVNAEDVAHVKGLSNTNVTFNDRGIPYLQTDERIVFGRAGRPLYTITFEAGVEYRLRDGSMLIGWRADPGEIQVRGTEQQSVVFTSHRAGADPRPGDWDGLHIESGTLASSAIRYGSFRYGGKRGPAGYPDFIAGRGPFGNLVVTLGGTINVTNSMFAHSAGSGISINNLRDVRINGQRCPPRPALVAAAMDSNSFEGNAEAPVYIRFPPAGWAPCP